MKSKNKFYMGVSLGFNSSVACVDDKGNLVQAISEERLSRIKNTKSVPILAIKLLMRENMSSTLYYSHYETLDKNYFVKYASEYDYNDNVDAEQNLLLLINNELKKSAFTSIIRVEHHIAHAYSVFPYYNVKKNSLIIVSDGYGDSISHSTMSTNEPSHMILEHTYLLKDSVALVYQFITGALGLKMHQHEGKVTGLAAYGDYVTADRMLYNLYDEYSYEHDRWIYKGSTFEELKEDIFAFCKKYLGSDTEISVTNKRVTSLCRMAQLLVSDEIITRIRYIPNQHKKHLYLAGGLFANVLLNTTIANTSKFKTVNVAPPMGDEGTAIGAVLSRFKTLPKGKFSNVYSGVDLTTNTKSNKRVWQDNVTYKIYKNNRHLAKYVAKCLAAGEIIHYRAGKSEFGPRALCHSSTFYQATDSNGTKYLNKTLGRSEYMPYAPMILAKDVKKIFIDNKKLTDTNQYMTAVLYVKDNYQRFKYPGAIHVDGSARVQILNDKKSFAYMLLKEYKKLTGLSLLINTSWNIHGNPTVATVEDSKQTWIESGFCGNALVHDKTVYRYKEETV